MTKCKITSGGELTSIQVSVVVLSGLKVCNDQSQS